MFQYLAAECSGGRSHFPLFSPRTNLSAPPHPVVDAEVEEAERREGEEPRHHQLGQVVVPEHVVRVHAEAGGHHLHVRRHVVQVDEGARRVVVAAEDEGEVPLARRRDAVLRPAWVPKVKAGSPLGRPDNEGLILYHHYI